MASNIRVILEVDNKKYISDLKAAETATKKFADQGGKVGDSISPSLGKVSAAADVLKTKLDNLKGVFAAVISASAIQQANAYANEVKDISETADVSVASILGLSKAFQVNGGSAEGARNAILKFGQTIGDAVGGSAEAQKTLEDVGITLKDIQTLGQQELLTQAVKGIANLESAAMRAKAQMAIFGKQAKSVNFPGVQEVFAGGTQDSAKYESAIKAGSDASEALNKNLDNLKQALLNVAEPLNKIVASINITVEGFQTFLKIIAAVGVAWFAFGKATSFVWTTFDGIGKTVAAAGGIFAMFGAEIAKFGNMFKAVFMNIGRALGVFETAYGGIASLGFALSGLLRIGLRFLGWVGIFVAVGEAINWAVKQVSGFDVIDSISNKLGNLWDKAKSLVGLGSTGAGAGRGGNADTLKQQQAQGEASRKAWEDQQKALDEAKAKAAEFAKRQAIIRNEIEKTATAYERTNITQQQRLTLEKELVGKTEDEREKVLALEDLYDKTKQTIRDLADKKRDWALSGTPEQKASIGIIDQEIQRIKDLETAHAVQMAKYIDQLQGARMIEKARLQDLENLSKAIEEAGKRQEALAGARLSVIGKMEDVKFEGTKIGKSEFKKQMMDIGESNRKAALEASRAFAAAFEEGGDGLTPEKAKQLQDGLDAIAKGYKDINDAQLKNLETSRTFSAGWEEAFASYKDDAFNAAMEAKTYFDTFSRGFEDMFVKMVTTGKFSFKDLVNTMIAEFARIESKKLFAGLFGGVGGGSSGSFFEGLFSGVKGLMTGNSLFKMLGFANGGNPPIGVPSIVGERGLELFVPRSAGTIIPNGQFGAMSANVTYNINAVDAASFRQMLAREPEFLYAVTEKGRSAIPSGRR